MGWRDRGDKQHLDKGKGFPEALLGGKLGLDVDRSGQWWYLVVSIGRIWIGIIGFWIRSCCRHMH